MPNRDLLENYPLYCRFLVKNLPVTLDHLPRPAIHLHCRTCKSDQTFNVHNRYFEGFPHANYPVADQVIRVVYLCTSCKNFQRYFLIKIASDGKTITKVGQDPPWDITPDRTLEQALGKQANYYRKGLINESQGYGIGAFGYYRRIVEEVIDDLLDKVPDLMGGEGRVRYLEALEKVKKTTVAKEKIALVKDMLPPILRPGGMNPLSVLHSVLSEGLHQQSDERCLELAMEVRETLVFLVSQVEMSRTSAAQFTESMRKLLDSHRA